jgi:hypothetical protein
VRLDVVGGSGVPLSASTAAAQKLMKSICWAERILWKMQSALTNRKT